MTEIGNAQTAVRAAERILTARADDTESFKWTSMSVQPLAAILLTTASQNTGLLDLDQARQVAEVTDVRITGDRCASWIEAALKCPDKPLGEYLARALSMPVRQRDSIRAVMLQALDAALAS
ncbi:hypothetical protein [Mycobacteroides abscessus]|uniref:hypothetical protein n=1 Tax=Mycobacteroides abscessus TaxID=36809 RepID=UPI0019D0FDBC|nr:hypothetical protein [Mycobacteroides abscessus]QSN49593.1 hypothetical protein I3U33_26305 [Mycobacteroides abscessus subsp. abscessus]